MSSGAVPFGPVSLRREQDVSKSSAEHLTTFCRADVQWLLSATSGWDKAERMTCRIGVDPRAVRPRLIVELRPA
jgi:hypothetical protein